jgi:hypothetical protein
LIPSITCRFDIAIQQACEEDLKTTCTNSIEEMEKEDLKKTSGLNCLQQFKDELKSQECKDQIARRTSRAARDIRFDDVLANACQDDRKKYCNDVQPVSVVLARCDSCGDVHGKISVWTNITFDVGLDLPSWVRSALPFLE